MRRIVRRSIRKQVGGLNLAADLTAAVAVNGPGRDTAQASVGTSSPIVQRRGRRASPPGNEQQNR